MTSVPRVRLDSERQVRTLGLSVIGAAIVLGVLLVFGLSLLSSVSATGSPSDTGRGAGPPEPATGLVDTGSNHGQIMFGHSCDSCHPGGDAGQGPSLRTAQIKSQYTSDDKIAAYVRKGGFDMPAFGTDRISDADLAAIAAFVRSLPQVGS